MLLRWKVDHFSYVEIRNSCQLQKAVVNYGEAKTLYRPANFININ